MKKKCKQLHIGTKDMGITYKMYKNNSETVVEKADTEKGLGVVFDSKLLRLKFLINEMILIL